MRMRVLAFSMTIFTITLAGAAGRVFAETEPEVCTRASFGRGVGRPVSACPPSSERSGALCYPTCRPGYSGVGPVCWQRCPAGYHDDGVTCRRNAHITSADNGQCPWHDKCGLVTARGCSKCPAGYKNDGCTCRKDVHIFAKSSHGRGVGSPLQCAPGAQYDAGLCYSPCRAGFGGVGPVCWETCPREFPVSCGVSCASSTFQCSVPIRPHMNSCTEPPASTACNGHPSLCDKRYDEVTFAASHNAFAVIGATPHISTANHSKNVTAQLRMGIRALMLDVHDYMGDVHLCHASCAAGTWGTLTSVLRSVRRFLEANPKESITLIFESETTNAKIWGAFVRSGLDRHVELHGQDRKVWPKLSELGGKVFAFSSRPPDPKDPIAPDPPDAPKLMYYFSFAFENPYSYGLPKDFDGLTSCDVDRYHEKRRLSDGTEVLNLFVMNHFTTPPSVGMGRINNSRESILAHAARCQRKRGRKPNFVVVDWADEGDVMGAVRELNGLR
jgi:hypothetical protein